MGRIGDLGWAIRDRAAGIALVLALAGCGAGAAGIVIALDAKDEVEGAAASSSVPITTPTVDPAVQASMDELNERVAAIEESVAQLRSMSGGETTTGGGKDTPEETTTTPQFPEGVTVPEGIELPPGTGQPESEVPPPETQGSQREGQ
jgi:hypothetical protein